MPAQTFATCVATGIRPLSILSGIIGIAAVLSSTLTNTANSTTLVASAPRTQGLSQGNSFPPRLRPRSCVDTARTSRRAPEKSTRFHIALKLLLLLLLASVKVAAAAAAAAEEEEEEEEEEKEEEDGVAVAPRCSSLRTTWPATRANMDRGTCRRKHQRQPRESAIVPPKEAPQMAPKPKTPFCMAWYMPRLWKGIMSELMIVAKTEPQQPSIQSISTTSPHLRRHNRISTEQSINRDNQGGMARQHTVLKRRNRDGRTHP